jgi:hypothetical protein
MNMEEQLEKLLIKFNEFRCQKTFHDSETFVYARKAYDYCMTRNNGSHSGNSLAFANFTAGYLKAAFDAERGSLC